MSSGKRLLHWGPITALTIIFLLLCVSCLVILVWIPPEDTITTVHAILFAVWVTLILKNFFKAAFLGPGLIPFKWFPVCTLFSLHLL